MNRPKPQSRLALLAPCFAAGLLVFTGSQAAAQDDAPPPPVKVPKITPKPVPVPVAGRDGQKPFDPVSPEDRKKLEAFDQAQAQKQAANQPAGLPRIPPNPNAKLEIPFGLDKHDFGTARQGDKLTHTFELSSTGTEPVIISQASPTCGCTVGEIKVKAPGAEAFSPYVLGTEIAPTSEVTVDATLDTTSKTNQTQVRINVYTNDPVGVMSLALNANVEPFLRATPAFLPMGDIQQGTERTGLIDISTTRGEKVLLTEDTTRPIPVPEGFSYELRPISPDENGKSNRWQIALRVAPDAPEGAKGYAMMLVSDVPLPEPLDNKHQAELAAAGKQLPKFYSINTNVNYRVLGVLSSSPEYLAMGLVRPGLQVTRNVRITCNEPGYDFSQLEPVIEGENGEVLPWAEHFQAAVVPVAGQNAADVQLVLDGLPDDADGSFRGVLRIKTGLESKPEVLVRFSGVCRKLVGVPTPVKGN